MINGWNGGMVLKVADYDILASPSARRCGFLNHLEKTMQEITSAQTMTLKEITDLLEVRHNDAMLTVERMAASPEFGELRKIRSYYINGMGAQG